MLAAAFFSSSKPKPREEDRISKGVLLKHSFDNVADLEADAEIQGSVRALRAQGITPFHWELEFPEVFRRGGFDVIVGNPPFAGKNTIIEGHAAGYLDWLKLTHAESHGNSDLAAHFFRRAFTLLKPGGCFGLIATNTIGQGDTRSTGLRWICANGGVIYRARKRYKWPGQAAVVVSVVHVHKGPLAGPYHLDGRDVDRITAYLFHAGCSEDPQTLAANEGKSFQGSIVLGMGFTFDDTDKKGVASPLAEMHRLIAKDPRNAERIFPYIGGEEVNDSPTHAHHRYVINFAEMSINEALAWPDLMRIVEERVKPERDRLGGNPDAERRRTRYWLWGRYTPGLFEATSGLDRVLVVVLYSPHLTLTFIPAQTVLTHKLAAFAVGSHAALASLQSRCHEGWARTFSATLKDDLAYSLSDCLRTFPFPRGFENHPALEAAGQTYYDFRAALMVRNNEGLTKTYNRFHDPGEMSSDIVELRRLHDAMDRAVLDAYCWTDLQPVCDFFPEFDEEEDEEESTRKKKRYRYRWPDEIRDDVLARLLVLNQQRYEEEVLAGLHDKESSRTKRRQESADVDPDNDQGELEL
jgi:hypothetical protein